MRLGIDASNLRTGGGLRHLAELLSAADPERHGFERVVVWAGKSTLSALPEGRDWLEGVHEPELDHDLPRRLLWARRRLDALARKSCDVLFVPGGSYAGRFRPYVTMARNMLPFEWEELRRYWASFTFFRLVSLRLAQARTFRRASGLIFLTEHAKSSVLGSVGDVSGEVRVIPHGVSELFRIAPRTRGAAPTKLLYVSIVDLYKHQWRVAEAVAQLRSEGFEVEVDFVGEAYPPARRLLAVEQAALDPKGEFLHYRGPSDFASLPQVYAAADLFVFASTCENMPNILLEAMASGLPIASSRRPPMDEILGDAGVYFDPEDPESITAAIRPLLEDPSLRASLAQKASERSRAFSWSRCAEETFSFLASVGARG